MRFITAKERDPEIIEFIQSRAREILKANGYFGLGLGGYLCEGCYNTGDPIGVYWPTSDGFDWVEVYTSRITLRGIEICERDLDTDDSIVTLEDLVPGYRDMQEFLGLMEKHIR